MIQMLGWYAWTSSFSIWTQELPNIMYFKVAENLFVNQQQTAQNELHDFLNNLQSR